MYASIETGSEVRNSCWHFSIYEHDKFDAQLSWAWNVFIIPGPDLSENIE